MSGLSGSLSVAELKIENYGIAFGDGSIHFAEYSAIFKFQFSVQCAEPMRYELQHKPMGDPLDHNCGMLFKFQFSVHLNGCSGAGAPLAPSMRELAKISDF